MACSASTAFGGCRGAHSSWFTYVSLCVLLGPVSPTCVGPVPSCFAACVPPNMVLFFLLLAHSLLLVCAAARGVGGVSLPASLCSCWVVPLHLGGAKGTRHFCTLHACLVCWRRWLCGGGLPAWWVWRLPWAFGVGLVSVFVTSAVAVRRCCCGALLCFALLCCVVCCTMLLLYVCAPLVCAALHCSAVRLYRLCVPGRCAVLHCSGVCCSVPPPHLAPDRLPCHLPCRF